MIFTKTLLRTLVAILPLYNVVGWAMDGDITVDFDGANGGTNCALLNLYAAHYAQRGYSRLGLAGYGEFLDYSFGQTNSCDNTAFEVREGSDCFLCVTGSFTRIGKGFDLVTLYHEANTRRLFKIVGSRTFPEDMSATDYIRFLRSMARDCDYRYKIMVPRPSAADVDVLLKNRHGEWSVECGDDSFLITLALLFTSNGSMRVTLTVESKQVRFPSKRRVGDTKEVEIDIGDL
ncbi:MAG: hypothetical protein IKU71_01530 [Kiritimatiellae bacterium]|nr:hypothetical protein [Kiritimatiellia bacterium]